MSALADSICPVCAFYQALARTVARDITDNLRWGLFLLALPYNSHYARLQFCAANEAT
jgi:hypothetical protein